MKDILQKMEAVRKMVVEIRTFRQQNNMAKHEKVDIEIIEGTDGVLPEFNSILYKLGNVGNIKIINK